MRFAERLRHALVPLLLVLLAGCGGGNSTQTSIVGGGLSGGQVGGEVSVDQPVGANTTEIVVDSGPVSGFSYGVTNLPYVSVTVCAPGSTTVCTTVDHVFLDTGSIGLRLLGSKVASLGLPPATATAGPGNLVECYPFVVGAVWGPLSRADVHIGGETASDLPVQIIDDASPPAVAPPADCLAAANGALLSSVTSLQANGVLGVGMLGYDCGQLCALGQYAGAYTLYYRCDATGVCIATAASADEQVQNPVSHFAIDNNGTLVVLPAVPDGGAAVARGRLVFGIGTQVNNQLAPSAQILRVQPDPSSPNYLYVSTTLNGTRFDYSYIDSGSNGLFFDDPGLPTQCAGNGAGGAWYCPPTEQSLSADIADPFGATSHIDFRVASADALFSTANTAFANLGGAAGSSNAGAFVWGLPFFFGRTVYTSIWGQALAVDGPWYAF
jgi:hypothetical protein